jgi:alpha-tubulin suppressor-like RCC1 family protein
LLVGGCGLDSSERGAGGGGGQVGERTGEARAGLVAGAGSVGDCNWNPARCATVNIAAGSNHTVALKSDGTVWAWGNNVNGQLGDGTTTNQSTSVQVSDLFGVSAVASGVFHSVALKSDRTVWAGGIGRVAAVAWRSSGRE